MPSQEPVTLVSFRRTHEPVVVPPGEKRLQAAGYSKGHYSPSITSRNQHATRSECSRPQPHDTIFPSDNISESSRSLSDSSPHEASCVICHDKELLKVTRTSRRDHGNRLHLHCAKIVSKVRGDIDSIRSHEQSESEMSGLNVAWQYCKLQREPRDMQFSNENFTVTKCECLDTKLCVWHRSCACETNSECVGSEHTAMVDVDKVSGDSDGDSPPGSDVERLSGTGSVSSLDAQFICESVHSLGDSVKLDSPDAFVDTDRDLYSNGSDTSTSTTDGDDTLDDSWLRQYILSQDVSHDRSRSTSQDRADTLSHDRVSLTPRQNRCRPSEKLDLHHGLRSDRGDSDDDMSFCVRPHHVSGYGSDDDGDDDDDDDYGTSLSLTSSQLDLFTPMYAIGELRHSECSVCLEMHSLHVRACCDYAACDDCLAHYYAVQVAAACIHVQCVGCDAYVPRDEIIARLDDDAKRQFDRFLVDANCDPCVKTCPRCSVTTRVNLNVLLRQPKGLRVTCTDCRLDWCFPCQAPWHEGATCRQYRKGDKQLESWARQHQRGQVNAWKCPKCKVSRPFCFFLFGR